MSLVKKKKFVLVGTGARACMFLDPIARDYSASCELLALCDLSQVRMNFHRKRLADEFDFQQEIRTYHASDFDRMLGELKPDAVIICTTDATHHDYIIRSLRAGCDVICEKPITVDAAKARDIMQAAKESRGKVRVTFNVRWMPGATKVKEILNSGAIGNLKHVQMEYLLDTRHGADYFRRWHSIKSESGGLLVHKSTHHFDVVNWWVNSIPARVYGDGNLSFYGKANAISRGEEHLTRYERYSQTNKGEDPFYFDFKSVDILRALYHDAESETGYIRDRNIFREGIDIEDSMSVQVRYRNDVLLSYSLNTFCSEEGSRVSLTGDRGRIEYTEMHQAQIPRSESNPASQFGAFRTIRVLPLNGEPYTVDIPQMEGGHGGGDVLLCEQIFSPTPTPDPYLRSAGYEQGLASALVGIAANQSIKTGLPVCLNELVLLNPAATRLDELI